MDLEHLQIKLTMVEMEEMPKQTYKKLIKGRIREAAFKYLIEKRNNRNGKGIHLVYEKLPIQNDLQVMKENEFSNKNPNVV